MLVQWHSPRQTPTPELAPDLERAGDLPIGAQLAWRLRVLIASGDLGPGDRLPGVRELASGTGVNVNTARAVYRRLEDDGLIVSRHGLGTFVAEGARPPPTWSAWRPRPRTAPGQAGSILATSPGRSTRAAGRALPRRAFRPGPGRTPRVAPPTLTSTSGSAGASCAGRSPASRPSSPPIRRRPERAGEPTHPLLRPKGHVADMAELEAIRDELVERLKLARAAAERRGERQHRARFRLEEMVSDPAAHKWEKVSKQDLGEPGCASVEVQPRWGPVGALMNWWRVKVSSGCPLAAPRRRPVEGGENGPSRCR